jgi:hypothetical protein
MGFLNRLFGPVKKPEPKETGPTCVERDGVWREAGEVFDAWTSGDLNRQLAALDKPSHPVDRHFLLLNIVQTTCKARKDPAMRDLCERIAWVHINEFPQLSEALREDMRSSLNGKLPQVPTFQYLATVLTERADFVKAIDVCKLAMTFGLNDGTTGGYEGRIERIQKKIGKHSASD